MGASDLVRTYNEMTQSQVEKIWRNDWEDAGHEDGFGSYSGSIATMRGKPIFHDRRFPTKREAYEFCLDKHEKWSAPIACSFYIPREPTKGDLARIKKAEEKVAAASASLSTALRKAREAFFQQKSKNVGCKGCKSSLNREKLNEMRLNPLKCPLCKTDLLTATTRAKLAALQTKLENARAAEAAARIIAPSKKIGWCVGGWAAS